VIKFNNEINMTETIAFKKALLLLHTVIFSYNSLDEIESVMLEEIAKKNGIENELSWAISFVNQDLFTAFKRMTEYLSTELQGASKKNLIELLMITWQNVQSKGAVSEVESLAFLKTARFLGVETEFVNQIRKI
jgi:uncharacterized tellurite resistance protein B-like protein